MGVVKMILLALLMCLFFVGGFAVDAYLNGVWGIAPLRFEQQVPTSMPTSPR